MSHRDLLEHARVTNLGLRRLGVGSRSRVALVLPNGPAMASAILCTAATAACAPLHPNVGKRDVEFSLKDLRATHLLVAEGSRSDAVAVARALHVPVIQLREKPGTPAGLFSLVGAEAESGGKPEWAADEDIALLLHTSGTTARPRLVPLSGRNLWASASHIVRALELQASDRNLNVMPLFHVHGVMAALLSSLKAGGSVVCTDGAYATRFFEWLDELRPTWYTAAPTLHQAIASRAKAHREIIRDHPLRLIRSSSAPLPSGVLAQLEAAFESPVLEAYGMTEASHQITSNPLPPRSRKAGSVGPAAGPDVAVMDGAGHLLPQGAVGEVVIRGDNVMCGYEGNDEANRAAFVDGWFRTGDQGHLDEDGYLTISGRLKELINRGGEKISPREVEEVLLSHPAVKQALTFAIPHVQLGEEIGAVIEVRDGEAAREAELKAFVAERLPAFKTPRVIRVTERIPTGPAGKLQRSGLAAKLGIATLDDTQHPATFLAPRTELERRILAIWKDRLKLARIGVTDRFSALGGDSLLAMEMIAAVCDAERVDLPFLRFVQEETVEAMAAEISEWRLSGQTASGIVAVRSQGDEPPLYCLPGHDGALMGITRLAAQLGEEQAVWALQYAALHAGTPACSVEELASRCVQALARHPARRPYRLLGICFGGLVAYEMARLLDARGERVELVTMIDCLNPGWSDQLSGPARFAARLKQWTVRGPYHADVVRKLGASAGGRYLLNRTRAFFKQRGERRAARAGSGNGDAALAAMLTDIRLAQTYRPRPYAGRALVVKANGRRAEVPALGWCPLVEKLEVERIPFHPHGAMAGENAKMVAAILRQRCLIPPT